jgi:serine/threonine-protein kinase ULK4
MAPELFQDGGVLSIASDFWSLGCVLYELATGKPPFYTSSLKDLITKILESDSPKVDSFSPDFNSLLELLLDKDPIKRISWTELKAHPFWQNHEFQNRKMPKQPQFDAYL